MTILGIDRVAGCLVGVVALAAAASAGQASGVSAQSTTLVSVYADGFVNPKGMAFGEDGTLYVAESGGPGDVMVPLPVNYGGTGPIGRNARVSKVPPGGHREDLVTGLPNLGLYGGAEMLGAASVAVLHGNLYEVAAGHITVSPTLTSIAPDGSSSVVARVGDFNQANPPDRFNGDAVPMGNPFGMIGLGDQLFITDGNYNRLLRVTLDGQISVLACFEHDPTTVGLAAGPDGNLYVAQFSPAPYIAGSGHIDRVWPDGAVDEKVVDGLTMPIGVVFGKDGAMYVLQFASEFSPQTLQYAPYGGQLLRVNADGTTTPIVTGLVFPTAITAGPDGALYVANYGNRSGHGQGQVLRVVPGDVATVAPAASPPDEQHPANLARRAADAQPAVDAATEIQFVESADPTQWGFAPAEVSIEAGQSVIFTNRGRTAHSATASGGAFDTGLLQANESATVRFERPGEYTYFCQPHPWMRGAIIVQGPSTHSGDDDAVSPVGSG
jgi:plastocyanin